MKSKLLLLLCILLIAIIGVVFLSDILKPKVVIENISPSSGPIGTEITIIGSGFDLENNDIEFIHEGSRIAGYINHVPSPDGKMLRFYLERELSACAFSVGKKLIDKLIDKIIGTKLACPSVAMILVGGKYQVAVVNKNGRSNSVSFEVT